MNEYNVIVDTGICGYDIELLIDADNKEDAEKQAMIQAKEMIETMQKRLHVRMIEQW